MEQELRITVLSGVSAGDVFRFKFSEGKAIVVGRADDSDLVLGDPAVSRKHVSIELRKDGFYIFDLGSAHGTVHMGFKVAPGASNARKLESEDEFKIGQAIFRVAFDEPVEEAPAAKEEDKKRGSAVAGRTSLVEQLKNRKKEVVIVLLGLLLLLVLFPGGKGNELPRQMSDKPMMPPEMRVVGYWPGAGYVAKDDKDTSHLDKAEFLLPTSHLLVEYDFKSEAEVALSIDDIPLETLKPVSAWRRRLVIVRDVLGGETRRLVFDNLDYPRPKGKPATGLKKWAVKNVRVTPLSRDVNSSVEHSLTEVRALSQGIDSSPGSLFALLRAGQRAVLEVLEEVNQDAASFKLDLETEADPRVLNGERIREMVELMLKEREDSVLQEESLRHIEALTDVVAQLDAELWRRVMSRYRDAKFAAKTKDYIVAHDSLKAVMAMFPDETDYRWVEANKMFNDNDIVRAQVREKPDKFRK